jgi:hypothetical protein
MEAISRPEVLGEIKQMLRRFGFSDYAAEEYVIKLRDLGAVADLDGWLDRPMQAEVVNHAQD